MLCAYGEEEINVQNCHATSWMVYDQFHEKLDLQIILGVVPGYYPYPGRRVGPEPIAHSWVETPGLLIDTNPQAVAYWTEEFWIDEATPAPRLNLKAIRKADLGGLKYYRKVEEALAQFEDRNVLPEYLIETFITRSFFYDRFGAPGKFDAAVSEGWIVIDFDYCESLKGSKA